MEVTSIGCSTLILWKIGEIYLCFDMGWKSLPSTIVESTSMNTLITVR